VPESSLSGPLFSILSSLVEERTGMHYDVHDGEIFGSKLAARAREAGFESPLDYYYYLRYDDPGGREFDALTEALVVNETYFFREGDRLRALCDEVVRPQLAARPRVRVWCAASSTGEEPMTLAMLLAERGVLDRVEIVASDISPRALARAKEGVFGARSLRALPDDARRWFDPAGDRVVVRPEVRDPILWRRVNLIDAAAVADLGVFDAILCRNVLIYFSEKTVRRVVGTLSNALGQDGRLLVGASESLLRFGTLLVCEERGGTFFYGRGR